MNALGLLVVVAVNVLFLYVAVRHGWLLKWLRTEPKTDTLILRDQVLWSPLCGSGNDCSEPVFDTYSLIKAVRALRMKSTPLYGEVMTKFILLPSDEFGPGGNNRRGVISIAMDNVSHSIDNIQIKWKTDGMQYRACITGDVHVTGPVSVRIRDMFNGEGFHGVFVPRVIVGNVNSDNKPIIVDEIITWDFVAMSEKRQNGGMLI